MSSTRRSGRCWSSTTGAAFSGCPTHGASCSSRSSGTPWRRCRRTTSRCSRPAKWVQFNYHVELREDRHHYSVPWQLRTRDPRTKVKLLYDERTVSIYYDNVRLAEYRRDRRPGGYTTLPDHMPPHGMLSGVRNDSCAGGGRWQRRGGDRAGAQGRQVPAAGVPFLPRHPVEKSYGAARLDRACRRALSYRLCSYRRIQNMLKMGLEEEQEQQAELPQP